MQAGSRGGDGGEKWVAALIPHLGNYRASVALFPPQHEAFNVLFSTAQFEKCNSRVTDCMHTGFVT